MQKFTCQLCDEKVKKEELSIHEFVQDERITVCHTCFEKRNKRMNGLLIGSSLMLMAFGFVVFILIL